MTKVVPKQKIADDQFTMRLIGSKTREHGSGNLGGCSCANMWCQLRNDVNIPV
jgi:hypothetical protein